MNGKGDFLAGVIVGSVVGAVAGILFAPASGKETRERISEKGKEVKEVAVDKAREKSEELKSSSQELISKLREKLPHNQEAQNALNDAEKEL